MEKKSMFTRKWLACEVKQMKIKRFDVDITLNQAFYSILWSNTPRFATPGRS